MVDTVIGKRYRLAEKIGTGGMADVYKAHDEVLGRSVAVKIMHAKYASDPAFASRFRQEAQAAANLQSPYIVNIYDWGQDGDTYYIIMEYVRGTDLKSVIREKGWLPSAEVANIGAQVCAALAIAHGYDIIHRDIKPHNIMVLPDGAIKVMDFGIAAAGNNDMTESGSVLGTAHYVSPEQAQGKPLGATSDLYSLGIVLYEASTGKLPFDADSPVAVALKQVNEAPVRPTRINPAVDPNLEAVIGRALTKDPRARYQTAEDMRRELLRIARPGAGATTVGGAVGGGAGAGRTSVMPAVGGGFPDAEGSPSLNRRPQIQEVPESNAKRIWAWVGIAAAVIIAGIAIIWAIVGLGGNQVTVPDVVGSTLEQAVAKMEDAGFVVADIKEVADTTVDPGTVVAQDPEGGTKAREGSNVTLTVSLSAETASVPDIVGMTEEEARTAITDAGFTPDPQPTQPSADVPAGSIIEQSPAGGEMAPKGSAISYVVSRGVETGQVPNVIGLKGTTAKANLEAAGFTVTVQEDYSSSIAAGIVISQNPNAGLTVGAGAEVVITVSKGTQPSLVTVPDVVGENYKTATSKLKALGFKVDVTFEPDTNNGTVLDQDPPSGTQLEKGSTISLIVDATS